MKYWIILIEVNNYFCFRSRMNEINYGILHGNNEIPPTETLPPLLPREDNSIAVHLPDVDSTVRSTVPSINVMGDNSNHLQHYDSDAMSLAETSVWSMGDNSSSSQYQLPIYDSDLISSSTETWSWGDTSSCHSTLTNGSSSDSNISDMQKLRGKTIYIYCLLLAFLARGNVEFCHHFRPVVCLHKPLENTYKQLRCFKWEGV